MHDAEPQPNTAEFERPFKGDRVENPQQYSTWRDYAFSEEPESEPLGPR